MKTKWKIQIEDGLWGAPWYDLQACNSDAADPDKYEVLLFDSEKEATRYAQQYADDVAEGIGDTTVWRVVPEATPAGWNPY